MRPVHGPAIDVQKMVTIPCRLGSVPAVPELLACRSLRPSRLTQAPRRWRRPWCQARTWVAIALAARPGTPAPGVGAALATGWLEARRCDGVEAILLPMVQVMGELSGRLLSGKLHPSLVITCPLSRSPRWECTVPRSSTVMSLRYPVADIDRFPPV